MGVDNVDRRLVALFEAIRSTSARGGSCPRPSGSTRIERPPTTSREVFDTLVERARDYVRTQRDAADRR